MSRKIKALTIWQPWASLVALGEKQYETRGWATRYRGLVAIHASARKPTSNDFWHMQNVLGVTLEEHGLSDDPRLLPQRAILCIGRLVDCIPTERVMQTMLYSSREYMFGNFHPDRFAWKIEMVHRFETPIPISGQQGLWDWAVPESIWQPEWEKGSVTHA